MLSLVEATVSVRTFTWLSCLNLRYCLWSCDLFTLLAFKQTNKERKKERKNHSGERRFRVEVLSSCFAVSHKKTHMHILFTCADEVDDDIHHNIMTVRETSLKRHVTYWVCLSVSVYVCLSVCLCRWRWMPGRSLVPCNLYWSTQPASAPAVSRHVPTAMTSAHWHDFLQPPMTDISRPHFKVAKVEF